MMPMTRLILTAALISATLILIACGSNAQQRTRDVDIVVRDVDPILRNTIGAQASIRNITPSLVSGYGIVVGLNGTGSSDAPEAVRASLEREMRRLGVGVPGSEQFADITPSQLIESDNTAIVIVSAVIPAGLPEGSNFDVSVTALPGSATSSLRGGRLYTTELRPGFARVAGPDVPAVADARGEVFINPFAGRDDNALESPTDGRILGGGIVIEQEPLMLLLDNASHARSREIASAINSRFPTQLYARDKTATGLTDEQIELRVPLQHRADIGGFLNTVLGIRVDQSFKADWAARYANELVEQPQLAERLTYALIALGQVSNEFLRPLYDHPDPTPRAAALTAGAQLGDLITRDYIIELAEESPSNERAAYIKLLTFLPEDGRVTRYLAETLNDPDPTAAIAAYETLRDKADPVVKQIPPHLFADKFELHIVPAERPMVYITLQRSPIIAIFDPNTPLEQGVFTSAWDGDLMYDRKPTDTAARLWVRDEATGDAFWSDVDPVITELVKFLAFDINDERPGVDLSYSETVSAIAELVDGGAILANFMTEQDRLALALLRAVSDIDIQERPELSGETIDEVAGISDQAQLNQIRNRIDADQAADDPFDFTSTIIRRATENTNQN